MKGAAIQEPALCPVSAGLREAHFRPKAVEALAVPPCRPWPFCCADVINVYSPSHPVVLAVSCSPHERPTCMQERRAARRLYSARRSAPAAQLRLTPEISCSQRVSSLTTKVGE